MCPSRWERRLAAAAALYVVAAAGRLASGQAQPPWAGALDEHPAIAYASRPVSDRVARLSRSIAGGEPTFARDAATGYLVPLLHALGIAEESQLLIFSKTGVQRAYTSPHQPRALYYDRSVVVGYVAGAPFLEIASHDPQQGIVFYTLDQASDRPVLKRATSCLSCHVSATTLYVPGLIVRSNTVSDTGDVMPHAASYDVDHRTPHPDRWGGWFVTSDAGAVPYAQRAHGGNITYSEGGTTSNQVFVDWLNSAPERRGYLSPLSDIVSLLVFDHETHAINLLTRVNWESRIGAADTDLRSLAEELADYLVFRGEAPPAVPLIARPGFAGQLERQAPKDRQGRSLADLDLDQHLFRYPCSFMVYSEAFDGLPRSVKQIVYQRMQNVLALTPNGRIALDILRQTKSEFAQLESTF